MAKAPREHGHGRYVIRTMVVGGEVRARAFLGRKAVADAGGTCLDDALRAMRAALDERDIRRRAARRDGLPTSQEFADAFARLEPEIGEHHRLMLEALLVAPGRTLSATEIAAAAGYSDFKAANAHFGRLAHMIADDLGYEPDRRADGSPIWTMTLATGADPDGREDDGRWRWTMRPQVAACLLGMRPGHDAA